MIHEIISDLIAFQLQKGDNFITEHFSKQRITDCVIMFEGFLKKQEIVGAFSNINHIFYCISVQ